MLVFYYCLLLHCTGASLCTAGFQALPRLVAENKNICQLLFNNNNNNNNKSFYFFVLYVYERNMSKLIPSQESGTGKLLSASSQAFCVGYCYWQQFSLAEDLSPVQSKTRSRFRIFSRLPLSSLSCVHYSHPETQSSSQLSIDTNIEN